MEPVEFCPKCGVRTEGSRFCRTCGTNLEMISQVISRPADERGLVTAQSGRSTVRVFSGGAVSNSRQQLDGHSTVAVFGGVEIDLTAAPLPAGETKINIVSVFGGTDILVPEDAGIRITGITLFGGFQVGKKDSFGGLFHVNDYRSPGYEQKTRRVHIDATSIFGGFEVKKPRRRKKKGGSTNWIE